MAFWVPTIFECIFCTKTHNTQLCLHKQLKDYLFCFRQMFQMPLRKKGERIVGSFACRRGYLFQGCWSLTVVMSARATPTQWQPCRSTLQPHTCRTTSKEGLSSQWRFLWNHRTSLMRTVVRTSIRVTSRLQRGASPSLSLQRGNRFVYIEFWNVVSAGPQVWIFACWKIWNSDTLVSEGMTSPFMLFLCIFQNTSGPTVAASDGASPQAEPCEETKVPISDQISPAQSMNKHCSWSMFFHIFGSFSDKSDPYWLDRSGKEFQHQICHQGTGLPSGSLTPQNQGDTEQCEQPPGSCPGCAGGVESHSGHCRRGSPNSEGGFAGLWTFCSCGPSVRTWVLSDWAQTGLWQVDLLMICWKNMIWQKCKCCVHLACNCWCKYQNALL